MTESIHGLPTNIYSSKRRGDSVMENIKNIIKIYKDIGKDRDTYRQKELFSDRGGSTGIRRSDGRAHWGGEKSGKLLTHRKQLYRWERRGLEKITVIDIWTAGDTLREYCEKIKIATRIFKK